MPQPLGMLSAISIGSLLEARSHPRRLVVSSASYWAGRHEPCRRKKTKRRGVLCGVKQTLGRSERKEWCGPCSLIFGRRNRQSSNISLQPPDFVKSRSLNCHSSKLPCGHWVFIEQSSGSLPNVRKLMEKVGCDWMCEGAWGSKVPSTFPRRGQWKGGGVSVGDAKVCSGSMLNSCAPPCSEPAQI